VNRRRPGVVLAGVLLAATAVAAAGQLPQLRGGGGQRRGGRMQGAEVRWATPADFDGAFMFCRIAFRQNPVGDGNGWGVDYPRADENLTFRLSELTKTPVSRDALGGYNHVVLQLTDPLLYRCPFIMATEPGGLYIDQAEADALRDYLQKGGFFWADDFWGERAFEAWSEQIAKALPPGEYPIRDIPIQHELFHMLYDMHRMPQIPSIGWWMGTGGNTSERGFDSAVPHARAIYDDRGRIMVLMTHNTDFGDAFEREGDNHDYFLTFAPEGYAFGVNSLLYAMTH
jgi:hypothetical protein